MRITALFGLLGTANIWLNSNITIQAVGFLGKTPEVAFLQIKKL